MQIRSCRRIVFPEDSQYRRSNTRCPVAAFLKQVLVHIAAQTVVPEAAGTVVALEIAVPGTAEAVEDGKAAPGFQPGMAYPGIAAAEKEEPEIADRRQL